MAYSRRTNGIKAQATMMETMFLGMKTTLAAVAIAGTMAFGAIQVLGLQTQEAHDADILALQSQIQTVHRVTLCLLWEVPPDRCEAATRSMP